MDLALRRLGLIAALLSACSQYAEQPPLVTKGPNHQSVLVGFIDVPDLQALQSRCKAMNAILTNAGACSRYYPPSEPGKPSTLILVALEPVDFNDQTRLALWGHEIGHGRGWVHR